MNFNEVIFVILDTVDVVQGLSVGAFLILLNRKKRKNHLFLIGLYLIFVGFSSIISIIDAFLIEENKLPFYFLWLAPSILYAYVDSISIVKRNKYIPLFFGLGIFELLIATTLLFLPISYKTAIENSSFYIIYILLGILYLLIMITLIIIKIRKNNKALGNQYSSLENRSLVWMNKYITIIIIAIPLQILTYNLLPEFYAEVLSTSFGLFTTFWISYHGLMQQVSGNLLIPAKEVSKTTEDKPINKSISEDFDHRKYKIIFQKVDTLISTEKLYLNPELTIVNIAEKINEHPRLISKIINTLTKENFNTYINKFRVEHAKKMLLSDQNSHLNIEGIGRESGFRSNSSFYAAFKKQLKITPLKFIKSTSVA